VLNRERSNNFFFQKEKSFFIFVEKKKVSIKLQISIEKKERGQELFNI
jgi:hypothetical protein